MAEVETVKDKIQAIAQFNLTCWYVLDHKRAQPRRTYDIHEWERMYTKRYQIRWNRYDNVIVSTIFRGLDGNLLSVAMGRHEQPEYRPALWETVIRGPGDKFQEHRYSQRQAAVRFHRLTCSKLRRAHRRLRARKGLTAMRAAYGQRRR